MKKYTRNQAGPGASNDKGAYNRYRGWEIPADENPEDEGYLIR